MNKVIDLKNKTIITVKYLFKRLVQSPLLLGWIIVGTIIEIIRTGYQGFKITVINLILLALFTIIIKIMTDKLPARPIPKLRHTSLELFLGIIFYIYLLIELSVVWRQIKIPYISDGIINLISNIGNAILKLGEIGAPLWLLNTLVNASVGIILELIPIIILFLILGYGFKKMGFVFTNLPLILILVGTTIIFGLPLKIFSYKPLYQPIITFFIMLFVNGLPEELIFRGYFLPRLEVVLKNPINALVIVAILFNMLHIPSYLASDLNIYQALLKSFSIVYPSGLIWGYLYLKTRSIVPGAIWHSSNTILGIIFIGIK